MKLIFKTLFMIGVAGLFTACDSASDINGDSLIGMDYDGVNIKDAKKIKKIVESDPDGEVITTDYTYNGDNLATVNAKSSEGDAVLYELSYSGELLSKIVSKEVKDGENLQTNYNLIYDQSGKKLINSNGTTQSGGVDMFNVLTTYDYTGAKVGKAVTVYNTAAMEIGKIETMITYSGDNVSNFDVKTTLSGMVFNVKSELFGYDTRKNPFGAFPEAFKAFSINYMMGSAPMAVFSKNNYKYLKVSLEGGPSQGINCDFKYDGDGYPTTGTRDNGTKITFEYY